MGITPIDLILRQVEINASICSYNEKEFKFINIQVYDGCHAGLVNNF